MGGTPVEVGCRKYCGAGGKQVLPKLPLIAMPWCRESRGSVERP
jgi:hypothetical protein